MAKSKSKILRQRSIQWGIRCLGWRHVGQPPRIFAFRGGRHAAASQAHAERRPRHGQRLVDQGK